MTRVTFSRTSDEPPPPLQERLTIGEGGAWTAWLSTGPAVGHFGGPADPAGPGARILGLAEAAAGVAPPDGGKAAFDATIDRVTVDGRTLATEYRQDVDGPWGELLHECRSFLDAAASFPVAAIGLAIAAPDRARLEHRGSDTIGVNVGGARAEGTVWTESGEYLTRGTARLDGALVEAGPGWSVDVPLEGLDLSRPGNLVVTMELTVFDEEGPVVAQLSAGRGPA
jgi:hypothetical protein